MENNTTSKEILVDKIISNYGKENALIYRAPEDPSPIRQITNYTIPVGFSSLSAAIAYFLTNGTGITILAFVGVFVVFGLIWAIREIQVTRSYVQRARKEIRKNSLIVKELDYSVTQSAITKGISANLPQGMMEVYIQYKSLDVKHLEKILRRLDRIYKIIYGLSQVPLEEFEKFSYEYSVDNFVKRSEEILRANPDDRFLIATISTGESIKIQCKTGWLPAFSAKDGDIVVSVPKGMLTLIVSASLLGGGIKYGLGVVKDYNDIMKTQEEIQNIRDTRKREREEADKLRNKINQAPPELKNALETEINSFLDLTTRNDEILGVKIQARGTEQNR